MNRYWVEKKKLNKDVTNKVIENICSIAMKNGAYGAKLLGSGAGGFVYILCPNNKKYIYKKLNRFKIVDFAFESSEAQSFIINFKYNFNEKYLIIGGSGFIGSSILERLNKSKLKVEATYFKNKNFIPIKKVKYFKGDLRNFNYCKKITKMVDTVIMCAAVSSGSMIIQNNPMYHVDDNVLMNLNVLKLVQKIK